MKIFIPLLFLLPLMAFMKPDTREKKLTKLVEKIWNDDNLVLSKLEVPDSLKSEFGLLFEVKINSTIAGYACYATAFGCRIGGCVAPSTPNVQSYETFDYIVIYDRNMQIIRLDIAEYGGQYGYEICRASWLKQFEGKTSGFVLNENIDGITGATISAEYLIQDLNAVGEKLKGLYETATVNSGTNSAD